MSSRKFTNSRLGKTAPPPPPVDIMDPFNADQPCLDNCDEENNCSDMEEICQNGLQFNNLNGSLSGSSASLSEVLEIEGMEFNGVNGAFSATQKSDNPPSELQQWLAQFQSWSHDDRLVAVDCLIDQVRHMMQVIEPQIQREGACVKC